MLAACRPDPGPPRVKKLPSVSSGPALRGGGPPRTQRIASYKIEAKLDALRHTITATQTLIWNNAGQSAVDTLPFHLYLNGFKNESSVFFQSARGSMRAATASDTGWGWISIESVQIAGIEHASKLKYP